jgi:hypothetical protein
MTLHAARYAGSYARLLACGALASISIACKDQQPSSALTPLHVAESRGHFLRDGYVEMVPPVLLPPRSPRNVVEVWLKLPPQGRLTTVLEGTRPLLRLPEGSVAARVEKQQAGQKDVRDWRIADVRGTRFGPGEQETFFVLRPDDRSAAPPLSGWEWRRGAAEQHREATRLLQALAASIAPPDRADAERRSIEKTNDCAGCHVHRRPENQLPNEHGLANRSTDASGCFQIQSVLVSQLPLETYFPSEVNAANPFMKFGCREGAELRDGSVSDGATQRGRARPSCSDGSIPWARFDVKKALAASSEQAEKLCASRRYLAEHLDDAGRQAFREGLTECGIDTAPVTAGASAP